MRTQAIRIHQTGGPDVLRLDEIDVGEPGPGEVRLTQTAIGLNFIDTYHRSGLYKVPLPSGIGMEAAARVEAVGSGVEGFKPGDRVAYNGAPIGSYAQARLYPADRLVPLPHWIDDQVAASIMLRGMTVEYLLRRTYSVRAGETILIHAAAGALGIIMCQWAKALGAHVIGTVGSAAKAMIAEENGAEHVLVTSDPHWPAKVRDITDGIGVPVVYDGVGRDTFVGSLDCLKPRGLMVSFGNASGPVAPFSLSELTGRGSLYVTRPSLQHYTATRQELMESAASLFEVLHRGQVRPLIAKTFPLKDAAEAHRYLESRQALGSVVLIPG